MVELCSALFDNLVDFLFGTLKAKNADDTTHNSSEYAVEGSKEGRSRSEIPLEVCQTNKEACAAGWNEGQRSITTGL